MGNMWDTSLGAGNGEQQVSLQSGCAYKNTIMHEISHALGWTHEQNRPDRDQNIRVVWDWISPSMRYNFNVETGAKVFNTPYDYTSIMQYHSHAFTTNWNYETMVSIDPNQKVISYTDSFDRNGWFQKRGLSKYDAFEINSVYSLKEHCESQGKVWMFWDPVKDTPKMDFEIPENVRDTCEGKSNTQWSER